MCTKGNGVLSAEYMRGVSGKDMLTDCGRSNLDVPLRLLKLLDASSTSSLVSFSFYSQ